jgi:type IV secretion system protein TrbG
VTASAPGLTTGLIVTTTRRTYYLTCQSVKTSPIRVLRWQYPPSAPEASQAPEPPRLLPNPTTPARYHVGYTLASQGRVPDWMPRHVVDDGKKLYSVYSEVTLFGTVPLLRMLGPHGPQRVHARQYLNVVIVDQLLATAELRVGTGERADTNRPALPSVTRVRLGRVLMLVLVSGSLLVGGVLWLLRTQGQPLTTALTDSAAWQP